MRRRGGGGGADLDAEREGRGGAEEDINKGGAELHGGVGVCVGQEEKCCVCAMMPIDKPMLTTHTDNNMAHPQSNRVVRWESDGFVGFLVGGAHAMSNST